MLVAPDDLVGAGPDLGFNGDLFAEDFGWRSPYTLESAFEDYLAWLKSHPY